MTTTVEKVSVPEKRRQPMGVTIYGATLRKSLSSHVTLGEEVLAGDYRSISAHSDIYGIFRKSDNIMGTRV